MTLFWHKLKKDPLALSALVIIFGVIRFWEYWRLILLLMIR